MVGDEVNYDLEVINMGLKEKVQGTLLGLGFVATATYLSAMCGNIIANYVEPYETGQTKRECKWDGPLSHTCVTVDKETKRTNVNNWNIYVLGSVFYTGDGNTGSVEEIVKLDGSKSPDAVLVRDEDYARFPKKFDEANKYFNEQLERFELK